RHRYSDRGRHPDHERRMRSPDQRRSERALGNRSSPRLVAPVVSMLLNEVPQLAATPPKPIQLGPFQIEHPFILAPMAGITNSPFRRLMRRRKSAVVVSELVSANGIEYASNRTLDLLKYHDEERVLGLQIFGENTERLVKACQIVEKSGADFVDLNLGCPVPKIVKNG